MTAIRTVNARSVQSLLVRPQPTPTPAETTGAGQASVAKASTKVEGEQPQAGPKINRFKTAVAKRADTERVNQSTTPQISSEPPTPSLETEVQKALQETYDKFTEGEGGSLADLQRALYDSVWSLYNQAQAKDSPAKAAMALTEFLGQVQDATPEAPDQTTDVTRAADRALAGVTSPVTPEGDDVANPSVSSGQRTPIDLQI
ncbi:MAG: hypothetical protein ACIARR_03365 [Phycisphaerales bacterium JB059]